MTEHIQAVLGLNVSPFQRGAAKAQGIGKNLKAGLTRALGFFGVGIGLSTLGRSLSEFADKLVDTSRKLGVSTDFLQAWNFAAQKNGVSIQASSLALQRFSRRVAEAANGQGELKDTIEKLGIKLKDNRGNMRAITSILGDYAEAIKGAENQQERLRLAFKAFDSEGVGMVSVLQDGRDGLAAMSKESIKLGAVVDTKALHSINRLSISLKTLALQTLSIVTERFGRFIDSIERGAAMLGAWSAGAEAGAIYDIANAQVDLQNNERDRLGILREETGELEDQAELEKEKANAIRRQIEAQRKAEADRASGKEPTLQDQLREFWKINRERETRARRLDRAAGDAASQAERLREMALAERTIGNDDSELLRRAQSLQGRADWLSENATIIRRSIVNPLIHLEQIRRQRRTTDQAAELESDAARLRRFGFIGRASELEGRADAMRQRVAEAQVGEMERLRADVQRIVTAIQELTR